MLAIKKMLIKYNYSSGNDIKFLVIHDTGNPASGANALMHYKYFNGGNRNSSAHYFVDDANIVQTVEDYNAAWHCGDGRGIKGISNHNSIGIEICINSNGNYPKAFQNTVDLVKYLMNKYGIDLAHVVRHYDASGKLCPGSMAANNWAKWGLFKAALSGANVVVTASPKVDSVASSSDSAAVYLQKVMNRLWFTDNEGKVLVEDGVMGSRTKQAVIKFQKVMGLYADGIAGSKTFGAIDSILAKPLCKFASDGYAVRYLQFRFGLAIDGKFGVMTKGKVQSYQHDMGLVADGIAGHNTWDKLLG